MYAFTSLENQSCQVFFNFCKNYCQNAQRKGKWYFFPYYFRKFVYFERSIDFEVFSLRVSFMLAQSYQVVINLALPSWTHRCSRFWFCHQTTLCQSFSTDVSCQFFFFLFFFCPLLFILLANLSNLLEMPLNTNPLLNSQMTERDQSEIIPDEEKCLLLKFCVVVCSWLCDVLTSTTHVHSEESDGNFICMCVCMCAATHSSWRRLKLFASLKP